MLRPGPRGKIPAGRVGIASPTPTSPDHHPWWFHPNRSSVRRPEDHFMRQLRDFDPELDCTWHPIHEHWAIWVRNPRIQNPICAGWSLLFNVKPGFLDARVFARLYQASALKWHNGAQYFAAVEREIVHEREEKEQQFTRDSVDAAMPSFDHSKIQISMRGKSNGSKFVDYHA